MNKKALYVLIIVVIAIGGFGYWKYVKTRVVSYQFIGQVKSVKDNSIAMVGNYIVGNSGQPVNTDKTSEVKILITSATKITRMAVYVPHITLEEFKKTGGKIDNSKLRTDETPATLDDLVNDTKTMGVSIKAKSNSNIYNKSQFEVMDIVYQVSIYK